MCSSYLPASPRLRRGSAQLYLRVLRSEISHPDWLSAILFDAVYTSAVLHNFGTQEVKDAVTKAKVWKDSFDPGGIITGVEDHKVSDERSA